MKYSDALFSVLSIQLVSSLKILLHSDVGTRSHIKGLLEIATELQTRQHEIVYAAVEDSERFLKGYKNITFFSLGTNEKIAELLTKPSPVMDSKKIIDPLIDLAKGLSHVIPLSYKHVYPRLEKVVHLEQPDVIICDFFSPACRDVAEMKGVPLISGFQTVDFVHIVDASYLTHKMSYGSITTESLSLLSRFYNSVVFPLREAYYFRSVLKNVNQARAQFGVPKSNFFLGDFSRTLGLANTFVGFEASVESPPNIKQVGPIVSQSVAPLTEDLVSFLNQHKRTIYVAFGSIAVLGSSDINKIILGCIEAMEQGFIDGVIWGLGKTNRADFLDAFQTGKITISKKALFSHPNFRILDWAPQEAILNHSNTVSFLSHGGLESTFEAIISKTPILCMSYFGDQPRNAKKLELAGIGIYINRYTMDSFVLANKITKLLNDPALSNNLERMLSIAILNSRKVYAADLVETYANNAKQCRPHQKYVYGQPGCEAAHLIPSSYHMSFVKANQLDVYLLAILLATSSFSLFSLIINQFILAASTHFSLNSISKRD